MEQEALAFVTTDQLGLERPATLSEIAAVSLAISLKRIADALVGDGENEGVAGTLHHIELRLGPQS